MSALHVTLWAVVLLIAAFFVWFWLPVLKAKFWLWLLRKLETFCIKSSARFLEQSKKTHSEKLAEFSTSESKAWLERATLIRDARLKYEAFLERISR